MDEQDVKIAVLEREVAGLREQQKAHKDEIKNELTRSTEQIWSVVKEIRFDIKSIFEFINQSRGGLYATIVISSGLGGIVVAIVSWALTRWIH